MNRYSLSWGTALLYWYPVCQLEPALAQSYAALLSDTSFPVFSYLPVFSGGEGFFELIFPSGIAQGNKETKIINGAARPKRICFPESETLERVFLCRNFKLSRSQANELLAPFPDRKSVPKEIWEQVIACRKGYSRASPMCKSLPPEFLVWNKEMTITWEAGNLFGTAIYTQRFSNGVYVRIFPCNIDDTYDTHHKVVVKLNDDIYVPFLVPPKPGDTTACRVKWIMASDRRVVGYAYPI